MLEREPGFGKPLSGELQGHRRLTYGRYRIVYRWNRERDHVLVWYVGARNERLYDEVAKRISRRLGARPG